MDITSPPEQNQAFQSTMGKSKNDSQNFVLEGVSAALQSKSYKERHLEPLLAVENYRNSGLSKGRLEIDQELHDAFKNLKDKGWISNLKSKVRSWKLWVLSYKSSTKRKGGWSKIKP
ncbi:hypothetical protein RUND412_008658 [Rhizina undulata]